MSHSDNIKFPWAFSGAAKIRCVDWICLPDKSYVFKIITVRFIRCKTVALDGQQCDKPLGWDQFPNATCFIEGIQFNIILLKVIRIELYAFIEETKVGDTCIV